MKTNPLFFYDDNMIELSIKRLRGTLISAHIADIHFTAFDPRVQYSILEEQFLKVIEGLPKLDIISVDGDLFDHKIMSNSDGVLYASLFIDRLVSIAKKKNSTVVLIHGTYQHDADQLKLFYHYLEDPTIDIRIVTTIQFEYIKGAKVLCIPELYGVDESIYQKFLFESGIYDTAFMHGTIKGAIYGDNVGNGRLFTIEDFCKCRGPIYSGHVHKSGCFNGYFYYTGTPYRYKHGEEEDKGFILGIQNLDNGWNYTYFQVVNSFIYKTIDIDDILSNDPKVIIDYINDLKQNQGIDFLKIRFNNTIEASNRTIINNYYRNVKEINVEFLDIKKEAQKQMEQQLSQNNEYSFILDNKYSEEEKFCMYVNAKEGCEFISVDKLKEILLDD